MKAVLICPGDRPAVKALAETEPLVLAPVLGKMLVEYWLDHLVDRGVRHVYLLVSDRVEQVRQKLGDGMRWGLKVELIPQTVEMTIATARAKYRCGDETDWLPEPDDVTVMDFLPGAPELPLFFGYAGWFAAVEGWLPRAASAPDRVGLKKLKPGVWVGLNSRISPDAELRAPCWAGENVLVGAGAVVGPGAVLEDGVVVAANAEISRSVVWPGTYVGELTEMKHSLAQGSMLIDWERGSATRVPDAFLLCPLTDHPGRTPTGRWPGRMMGALTALLTLPLAFYAVLKAWLRGKRAVRRLVAVRPHSTIGSSAIDGLIYHEFTEVKGWLQRWPQLWKVVQGEFDWVGNRPLSPAAAVSLSNDFERLWLKAPIGLFSLADAEACREPFNQEARVHASIYAMRADWRLDLSILSRVLGLRTRRNYLR
jgi:hypothetical protein